MSESEKLELVAKYESEALKQQERIEQLTKERDEARAACAAFRRHWEIARGMVHTNFWHVPSAIRACDWIETELQKALTDCGKDLLARLEEARWLLDKSFYHTAVIGSPEGHEWMDRRNKFLWVEP